MKNFLKSITEKIKQYAKSAKIFLSSWKNCVLVAGLILSVVFLCMWNVAKWCRITGMIFLGFETLFASYLYTIFYLNFTKLMNIKKKELLIELAEKFNKEEYLQLKTPFNEKEEAYIQSEIKRRKQTAIFLWIISLIVLYAVFIVIKG